MIYSLVTGTTWLQYKSLCTVDIHHTLYCSSKHSMFSGHV